MVLQNTLDKAKSRTEISFFSVAVFLFVGVLIRVRSTFLKLILR